MNKNINESVLNMKTVPTISPDNDWCLSDYMDDDIFNCGIDANVAPMVGSQDGQALSTMTTLPEPEDANMDYMMQMAGLDGTEVEPVVQPTMPEPEPEAHEDIFSIAFEPEYDDVYNDYDYAMTDDDYNDILANSRMDGEEAAPTLDTEVEPDPVEDPIENEVDMFDGIMNEPEEEIPTEEVEVEPVSEELPLENPEETPVEDIELETVETNPEDMVLEKQPEVDDTEAQQIKDYLVHNKEVLYGPASAKIESYKKSLEGKTVEELRAEAEEVSPNWKKYIEKYKVNEAVETKKEVLDDTKEQPVEDDVHEEIPAGQEILTEEGEELTSEDLADIESLSNDEPITEASEAPKYPNLEQALADNELIPYIRDRFEGTEKEEELVTNLLGNEELVDEFYSWGHNSRWGLIEDCDKQAIYNELLKWLETGEISDDETMEESLDDLTKTPIKTGECVPSELKESVESTTEAANVDVEPEEVKVEETTEADLKHEIPENDMIKDNVDTGEEVKYDEPVEAENGEIETKEFTVEETKESDLKHEIKDNEPIKDNIDTGKEVKFEVELDGGEVKEFGLNSDVDVKSYITENVNSIKIIKVIK